MASGKVLVPGLLLCIISTTVLLWSMLTDKWFVIDASEYILKCKENKYLEETYPWQGELHVNEDIDSKTIEAEDDVPFSGDKNVILQQNDRVKFNRPKIDRPANDWPGLPLKASSKSHHPAPLLQRVQKKQNKFVPSRLLDDKNGKRASVNTLKKSDWDIQESKVNKWNQFAKDLRINLYGFGGRDITFYRGRHAKPVGSKNNECVNQQRKSISNGNKTELCANIKQNPDRKLPSNVGTRSCEKRQFSAYTGLWQTCFDANDGEVLRKVIERGKLVRCAPVRYGNLKVGTLPAGLSAEETEDVYREEWKTLHLRRILTSFLCMAAPVQVFGLILVIIGWITQRGFIIYSGGLVLVMSGLFQLLAVGTSVLLFDAELNRSPAELYNFPEGVKEGFGRSAQAIWFSTGSAMVAGMLCALAPVFLHSHAQTRKQINGVLAQEVCGPEDTNIEEPLAQEESKVDVIVNINAEPYATRKQLQGQAYSVDTGTIETQALNLCSKPFPKLNSLHREQKTQSVPNLPSDAERLPYSRCRPGRSSSRRNSRRRAPRALSPLAVVRTPQAAILALENERNIESETKTSDALTTSASVDVSDNPRYRLRVQSRMHRAATLSGPVEGISYSQSGNLDGQLHNPEIEMSCLASVDVSQRLRHARYARRTSHSYEETAARIRTILQQSVSVDDHRTRSLPRRNMAHTSLSEIAAETGGVSVLRNHCQVFLQRQNRLGGITGSDQTIRARPASSIVTMGRHHSEEANLLHPQPVHPAVARWQDGGRWSRSLDENKKCPVMLKQHSFPCSNLAREGTLDSVEECVESEIVSPEKISGTFIHEIEDDPPDITEDKVGEE
ncbi:uncharacterized protein LOC144425842 [Styela clava]